MGFSSAVRSSFRCSLLERLDAHLRATPTVAGAVTLTPEALADLGWDETTARTVMRALDFAPARKTAPGAPEPLALPARQGRSTQADARRPAEVALRRSRRACRRRRLESVALAVPAAPPSPPGEPPLVSEDACRIDVWLWRARFFKSRSLAARFADEGRVRLTRAGRETRIEKSSQSVKPGDALVFALGGRVIAVRIAMLGERRGPASEARALYDALDENAGHQENLAGRRRGAALTIRLGPSKSPALRRSPRCKSSP